MTTPTRTAPTTGRETLAVALISANLITYLAALPLIIVTALQG